MMKSIVEEKLVSFKELEQKIFDYVCEMGRDITRIMLDGQKFHPIPVKVYKGGFSIRKTRKTLLTYQND